MSAVRALVLAAGRGMRMRPLTDTVPKPVLRFRGKMLAAWQIEGLRRAGVTEVVVNTAHHPEKVEEALGDGSPLGVSIRYSREGSSCGEALETLGGIARALPLLSPTGEEPFIVAAGDIVTDYDYGRLVRRAAELRRGDADAHLVLVPNPGFHRQGDMHLTPGGLVARSPRTYTYSSIGVFSPRIFRGVPVERAKLFPWLYGFCDDGRVTGELFTGSWRNIGTPEQLREEGVDDA